MTPDPPDATVPAATGPPVPAPTPGAGSGSGRPPGGDAPLLEVVDLRVVFGLRSGPVHAVDGVHLTLGEGETLAIVGESGSGKSATAHAVMGLLEPPATMTGAALRFRGADLLAMTAEQRRKLRGTRMAMIFQDASSALNPVFSVGWQIAEPLRVHAGLSRRQAREQAIELLHRVGIPAARARARAYPHELSGGMRQRVMIAMALALDPDLLIADEPTAALDVTVQAQVIELLGDLQQEHRMGLLLITHDLGVVAQTADRVAVMYAGRVVESGPTRDLLQAPAHPYTEGLLRSIPTLDDRDGRLHAIEGAPPSPTDRPVGCAFHPRCDYRTALCTTVDPPRYDLGTGDALGARDPDDPQRRASACHHHREVGHGR